MKRPPERDALSPDLRTILATVEILSGSSYLVGDHQGDVDNGADVHPTPSRGDLPGNGTGVSPLATALAEDIYGRLYSRQGDRSVSRIDPALCRRHLAELSAANVGRGTWEPGWRIRHLEGDGSITAERRGVLYRVAPDALLCPRGGEPTVGGTCRVRIPEESLRLAPGYYLARGDADASPPDPGGFVVRLYWHLRYEGAVALVAALTAGLNRRRIPFKLKVLRDPRVYRRADAGVLYLEPPAYAAARGEILRAWREVRGALRPKVPMLTAHLAPGLGVAEGPGDGSSFGEHRCALIADSLVRVFEKGRGSRSERAHAVAAALRAAGLDPERPHLEPGSTSSYRPFAADELGAPPRSRGAAPASMTAHEAARRIGDVLCREAFWHDGRCTWVGHSRGEKDSATGNRRATVATLGADLYRGTAGVGLFLAELHALTGEESHRRTAVAAFSQALAKLSASAERYRPLAFYDGWLGVAWAACRVANLCGDAQLAFRAEELLSAPDARSGDERRIDLLSGNAGAILALLDLQRTTGEARFLETALALGEETCRAAARKGPCWSWENDPAMGLDPSDPPLAGFAHGAAGIGLGLLELFAATGQRTFLEAATGAFAYEDALFDAGCGNWPDLRGAGVSESPNPAPKFMTAWCHGAPGIALSRLCAVASDPVRADRYEAVARTGLATTQRALEEGLARKDSDTSLCHGLFGMIDIMLTSAEILKETAPRQAAREAVGRLVDRHGERGDWPSGVASRGRSPSLFLGEAGVGYTLLRLSAPRSIPPVLVPGSGRRGGPF